MDSDTDHKCSEPSVQPLINSRLVSRSDPREQTRSCERFASPCNNVGPVAVARRSRVAKDVLRSKVQYLQARTDRGQGVAAKPNTARSPLKGFNVLPSTDRMKIGVSMAVWFGKVHPSIVLNRTTP